MNSSRETWFMWSSDGCIPREVENYLSRGYNRINGALRKGETTREVAAIDNFIYDRGDNIQGRVFYRSVNPVELSLSEQRGFLSVSESTRAALFSARGRVTVRVVALDNVMGVDIASMAPERHVEAEFLLQRNLMTIYNSSANTLFLKAGDNELL